MEFLIIVFRGELRICRLLCVGDRFGHVGYCVWGDWCGDVGYYGWGERC